MQLTGVEIDNFMIFGEDVYWDIPERTTMLVTGQASDTGNSNETGKSSIFEAIYWCITGKTVRSIRAAEVVHLGCSSAKVATSWKTQKGNVKFTRYWSKNLKYVTIDNIDTGVTENFHDSAQGTQAVLEYFGASAEIIALLGFFGKKFMTFSRMSPSDRADLFDLLAEGSKWEEAASRTQSKSRNLKRLVTTLTTSLEETLTEGDMLKTKIALLTEKQEIRTRYLETQKIKKK